MSLKKVDNTKESKTSLLCNITFPVASCFCDMQSFALQHLIMDIYQVHLLSLSLFFVKNWLCTPFYVQFVTMMSFLTNTMVTKTKDILGRHHYHILYTYERQKTVYISYPEPNIAQVFVRELERARRKPLWLCKIAKKVPAKWEPPLWCFQHSAAANSHWLSPLVSNL